MASIFSVKCFAPKKLVAMAYSHIFNQLLIKYISYFFYILKYRSKKVELNNVREKIDSLNNVWDKSKTKLTMHKNQVDTEKNKLQTCHEEVVPLFNLYSQLLR